MKGTIAYQDFNGDDIMELMEAFEVKDEDAIVKMAVDLHLPAVASAAVISVGSEPVFRVLYNGGVYDVKMKSGSLKRRNSRKK